MLFIYLGGIMNFKKIDINSFKDISPFFKHQQSMACEYSFGILYFWKDYFNYQYAIKNDCLFIKQETDGVTSFFLPLCDDLLIGINTLKQYCAENSIPLNLSCVPESYKNIVEAILNKEAIEEEIWKDYIYDINVMASYNGKSMQKKRNHYNKFINKYPVFSYEKIDNSNLNDIKDFYNNKCLSEIKDSTLFIYEKDNMNDILTNYNDLPFVGITLKVNNEVIGYTIGEIVNETLMVHVEKADKDYEGSFPTIQKLFSCYCLNKYPYLKIVNREDDAGDEGLRKSKLSYKPIGFVRKYMFVSN